jgi:hypothetical protein
MSDRKLQPEMPVAFVSANGRIHCGRHEYTSGDCVDVQIDGVWHATRIEYDGRGYYSIDHLPLIGNPVRPSKD